MGAEETTVRGVDSSAIDVAKNDIECEDDRRNTQHRDFYKAGYGKVRASGWQILLCIWELLTASLNK
jgi:hypothetical protein